MTTPALAPDAPWHREAMARLNRARDAALAELPA